MIEIKTEMVGNDGNQGFFKSRINVSGNYEIVMMEVTSIINLLVKNIIDNTNEQLCEMELDTSKKEIINDIASMMEQGFEDAIKEGGE